MDIYMGILERFGPLLDPAILDLTARVSSLYDH